MTSFNFWLEKIANQIAEMRSPVYLVFDKLGGGESARAKEGAWESVVEDGESWLWVGQRYA